MGALQIPIGTYHRSISGQKGSIVLNQAFRDNSFNAKEEFNPIYLNSSENLIKAKRETPIIWYWDKNRINKIYDDTFSLNNLIKQYLNSLI